MTIVDIVKGDSGAQQGLVQAGAIDRAAAAWDAYFLAATPLPPRADDRMELLSTSRRQRGTNKNQTTPNHAFFDAAEVLLAARAAIAGELDLARLRLLRDLIDTVGPELRRRKRERRVIAFDDMLYNLYAALESGEHPGWLVAAEQFPVALIDEFQDTDPLQFAIFDRVYGQGRLPVFWSATPSRRSTASATPICTRTCARARVGREIHACPQPALDTRVDRGTERALLDQAGCLHAEGPRLSPGRDGNQTTQALHG